MNKVITAFKRIRLRQIVMVFMAGVLLFVSTACSNAGSNPTVQAQPRQEAPAGKLVESGKNNPRPEVPDKAVTSSFQKGTMNEFSDVDPRAKEAGAAAADKANLLKENAERNVIDQTSNVGENTKRILDKKGENAEDFGKNLSKSAENTKNQAQGATEDLTRGTKQAAKNVKDNTLNTTRDLTRSANRAAEDTTEDTKAARGNLFDKAQQAINNTNEFVQGKVNQAADGTQRSVDKAAQNTLNKTGNALNNAMDIE